MALFVETLSRSVMTSTMVKSSLLVRLAQPSSNMLASVAVREKSSATQPQGALTKKKALIIDKNLSMQFCGNSNSTHSSLNVPDKYVPSMSKVVPGSRPLVVLLSWLMAQEKNLEKYRSIYFKHGFDVLTVKTSPFEMLFPALGSQKVGTNLLNFLKNKVSTYPNVLIHGFSVGAYQFGEMLVQLQRGLSRQEVDGSCEIVKKAIKGVIFDSAVDVEGAPYGISRSVAGETFAADMLEKAIKGHMKLFYPVATRHYEGASRAFKNTPLRCPALLLLSREDRLGNPVANEVLADRWRELGINVSWKCWDKSRHVAHLHKYPDEYVSEVNSFLKHINLGKEQIPI